MGSPNIDVPGSAVGLPPVSPEDSQRDLREILRTLVGKVNSVELPPTANKINVVRADILESALRAIRRRSFNPERTIDVVFVDPCGQGEGSVDNGGPTRDFLNLLMKAVVNSRFFVGPVCTKNLGLDAIGMCISGLQFQTSTHIHIYIYIYI